MLRPQHWVVAAVADAPPGDNATAVMFLFWAFYGSFWPQYFPMTPPDFNWTSTIFVSMLVVASVRFRVGDEIQMK
jgi:hypothetical protein